MAASEARIRRERRESDAGRRRKAIRVLLVEDVATDAELAVSELKRAGLKIAHRVVQSEEGFRAALADFLPEVILSDFSMPGFDGMYALRLACELCPDSPFIFVSGTLGEEYAIRALQEGATDYVLKTNLLRLPVAVERALNEVRERAVRREAEQARRESEAGLRRAQSMAGLAHVITRPDGSFEAWSETLPKLAGLEPAEMPKGTREWLELVHLEDRAHFRATAIEAGRRGTRMEFEYRLRRSDGAWIHIRQASEPIEGWSDAQGKMRWFGTLLDVTAQKQAARSLQSSVDRYRTTFEQAAVGIVHSSLEDEVLIVNQTFCEMTGYSRTEAIQLRVRDLIHADDLGLAVEGREKLLEGTGAPYGAEIRVIRKDGSHLWVQATTSLVRGAAHKPLHFVSVASDITERKRAEMDLRESEARFRSLTELSSDWYWEQDAELRFVSFSGGEGAWKWGGDQSSQIGKRRWEMDGMMPLSASWNEHRAILGARRPFRDFEYMRVGKEGERRYVSASGEPVFDRDGRFQGYRGTARDITEQRAQRDKIERLSRVHAVLSGINAAIVRVRDRGELYREACRVAVEAGKFPFAWLGVVDRARERLEIGAWAGRNDGFLDRVRPRMSLRPDAPEGEGPGPRAIREGAPVIVNDVQASPLVRHKSEHAARGIRSFAMLPILVNGEAAGLLALHASETGFFDAEEMRLLLELAGDISFALEVIEKEEKLDYLALHDPLTGLANRTLLGERLGQSLRAAGQTGDKLALAWIDLERLTTVNESLGRRAGDMLLKQVGERLARVGGVSNVARIAADHFAAMLPALKGRSQASRAVTSFVQACFAKPFDIEGTELKVAAKAGLALFPNDGADAETLMGNAEAALRKAKESGERHIFYAPDMTERTGATLTLENKLRRAVEKDEFVLHYQPKVDTETLRIVGMEALIRWQSPELGLVPPGKFIPLMEETGMILDVGRWALGRASADHRRWTEQQLTPPRVAVNVSAIQLRQRDFVSTVEQAILEGVAPTGIDLEITESLVMEDIESNIQKLKEARALGLRIAIDDFGTGYSSLSYLAKLPVQTLKIDRSFIVTMLNEPGTMTLVQTIISLAHSLKLKVVAEGVDAEEQAKVLRLLRCDEMQGYLFSKPVPFEQLSSLLAKEKEGSTR